MDGRSLKSAENGKKGGRPPGKKNKKTLEKEAALEAFQKRVRNQIDPLFDSQYSLARGVSFLYKIVETGKGEKKKREHVLITDPQEIKDYLDNNLDEEDGYYYITTEKPDNNAIRDMLDRTFGKSPQALDVTSGGEKIGAILDKLEYGDNRKVQ